MKCEPDLRDNRDTAALLRRKEDLVYPPDISMAAAGHQQEVFRGIVHRKGDDASKWLNKRLSTIGEFWVQRGTNGLGLKITARSMFAEHLLRQLHYDVFGLGFELKLHREENGDWSSVYEYLDPVFLARLQ